VGGAAGAGQHTQLWGPLVPPHVDALPRPFCVRALMISIPCYIRFLTQGQPSSRQLLLRSLRRLLRRLRIKKESLRCPRTRLNTVHRMDGLFHLKEEERDERDE